MTNIFGIVLVVCHVVIAGTILGNWWYLQRARGGREVNLEDEVQTPKVSILVPARNEEAHMGRLIESVLGQTYSKFELIIYNDASEDNTQAIINSFADPRLVALQGGSLPNGWIGKVHALYQATRKATGELYLFLDADVELTDEAVISEWVTSWNQLPSGSVVTGLPRLRGGGLLLVSLLPHIVQGALPWPLVRGLRAPSLGMINGQCWMIDAEAYHQFEPHQEVKNEVLEDVKMAHYLKRQGLTPVLLDARSTITVDMYDGFAPAWRGFRKNVYLLMGGKIGIFVMLFALFGLVYVVAPWVSWVLLLSLYLIKGMTDRYMGFPWWVTLFAPVTMVLASLLQLDSAWHHWRGQTAWKGRRVGAFS